MLFQLVVHMKIKWVWVLIAAFMFLHFEQQNLLTKINNLAHVKNKAFKQLSCMLSIIVNCALHYSKLNKMRIIWQQRRCKLHYSFTFEGMPLLWQQTFEFETDVTKMNVNQSFPVHSTCWHFWNYFCYSLKSIVTWHHGLLSPSLDNTVPTLALSSSVCPHTMMVVHTHSHSLAHA